ncbi:hypothetical protein EPUS_04339 [Endocarpon pusillum Z07020]|uniref:Uncharacterized protein n=1 Tax=Endocarpon pusillum (strain Z07020 / HMAS-L-300199) TaxID=1263415 RepID=U1GF53_ENDPU|nr:uncharacterized protein EPUS_04339 [Endocarpon pusillum Z07020]ERF76262.1 hypothetical protein EPUS_04339 [Endocarpon pusillum Z07020]
MTTTTTTSSISLLTTITESLTSATSSFPAAQPDSPPSLLPPSADGISLLDTKNDLLLSYLQDLVFLIVLKLRHHNGGVLSDGDSGCVAIGDEVVRKLVETRVYLEKGVRPLEGRLRYQIEKVVRAADEVERSAERSKNGRRGGTSNGMRTTEGSDASNSDSDSSSGSAGSEDTTASHEDGTQPEIDDLSYRPNPSALLRRSHPSDSIKSTSRSSGAYRPPQIAPTSMSTTSTTNVASRSALGNRKSHLLDEYISTELSSNPRAEPSIGSNSTILNRGRGALSTRERDKERERTEYEERNFSRLPRESKAEKRKNMGRDGGNARREGFGGEDWTGLGEVGDRVARSIGSGSGKGGVLERREKRRRVGGDVRVGGGGSSGGIGEGFEKMRKIMEGRAEKKRKGR